VDASTHMGLVSPEPTDPRFRSALGPWPTAETRLGFDRAHDLYRRARRVELSGTRLAGLSRKLYIQARNAWYEACEDYRCEIEELVA
jgi:hypothetical protein